MRTALVSFAAVTVLSLSPTDARAQRQDRNFADPITIASTIPVAVTSLVVSSPEPYDVALTAHVYLEGAGFDYGRYEIGICRDNAAGAFVGRAHWRPSRKEPSAGSFEADVVTVTGFDTVPAGARRYVLCVRKYDAITPNVTIHLHGLNAVTAPAGGRLAGTQTTEFSDTVPLTTTPALLASVSVDAGTDSDIALTGHVFLEGQGLGGGNRYEIGICRGSASGPMIGRTLWRPPSGAEPTGYSGDTIAITGFDAGVSGHVTYVLCGMKQSSGDPDSTASLRGLHAVRAPSGEVVVGVEETNGDLAIASDPVALATLEVPAGGVRFTGHVYLEKKAFEGERYVIGICRGSVSGPWVGLGFWRPNSQSGDPDFIGDAITITGYDEPTAPATYVLCARKHDSAAPDLGAYTYGLVATVPEPGRELSLLAAAACLCARHASARRTRRTRAWIRPGSQAMPDLPAGAALRPRRARCRSAST